MDQTGVLTVSIPMFVGSIGLTWFLLTRAPRLPKELATRATESTIKLRLVGSALLRDLRNDLNIALRDYDAGNDPYLTRVDYQVPSATLKRYRKIMQLEKAAREAPGQVQRRIRVAIFVSIALTMLFFAAAVLGCLKAAVSLVPSYFALSAAGILVAVGLILSGFFFVKPYVRVSRSELRGLDELRARPGLNWMAEALGVETEEVAKEGEW